MDSISLKTNTWSQSGYLVEYRGRIKREELGTETCPNTLLIKFLNNIKICNKNNNYQKYHKLFLVLS